MAKETQVFLNGPWRGARYISEPTEASPDRLYVGLNGYVPDPIAKAGYYSRPGFNQPTSVATAGNSPQGVYSHQGLDGTNYNFIFANGKVWRWSTALTGAPVDVTPLNVTIDTAKFVYAASLADSMIVNDGFNKMWVGTNLGSTPITATLIEQQTPSVALSVGSTDVRLANAALTYTIRPRVTAGGQHATIPANAVGTMVGALGQIAANTWGVILVELDTATGAFVYTAAFAAGAGYATEALAIAALPARTTARWYVGYVTVRADAGFVWIAGTDAFAGGTTGNQAQTTNYYAGEGPAYSVYGQPVIYTGALIVIYRKLGTVAAQTTIGWSEPNLPTVGYQQSGYDNQWTLTQTSSSPLYALAATNDALYYFRQLSIGAVAGAPGVNFQGTATHDVVSGNVGCVSPATVSRFLNYVYFCDGQGRPWRFPVGGTPEPIWLQAREIYEDNAAQITTAVTAGNAWACVEPNLGLYLTWTAPTVNAEAVARIAQVFDLSTGLYMGQWSIGSTADPQDIGGIVRNANGQACLVVLEGPVVFHPTTLLVWRMALHSENVWGDGASTLSFAAETGWNGFAAFASWKVAQVAMLAELGNGGVGTQSVTLTANTTEGSVSVGSVTPVSPSFAVTGRSARWVWMCDGQTMGRGFRLRVATTVPNAAGQFKCYRIEAHAVASLAGIEDR